MYGEWWGTEIPTHGRRRKAKDKRHEGKSGAKVEITHNLVKPYLNLYILSGRKRLLRSLGCVESCTVTVVWLVTSIVIAWESYSIGL